MNTKILLISIALILFTPQSISIGASLQKQLFSIENHSKTPVSTPYEEPSGWIFNWAVNEVFHHAAGHCDEDGKSHHYHYTRFRRNRKTRFLCLLLKFLLIITHASSLLYIITHLVN